MLAFMLAVLIPSTAGADPSTRIINGSLVGIGSWPSLVALEDETTAPTCGGTLIAPFWVMTAAHCDNVDSIVYGTDDIGDPDNGTRVKVIEQFAHPSYAPTSSYANDIRLLRLESAPLGVPSMPLAIPSDDPPGAATAKIAGWGATEFTYPFGTTQLREASVDVFTNGECGSLWSPLTIFSTQICASYNADINSRDICFGDSGGPLTYNPGSGAVQVGISSFVSECANGTIPSVFTRVSSYRSWMDQYTSRYAGFPGTRLDFGTASTGSVGITKLIKIKSAGEQAVTITGLSIAEGAGYTLVGENCTSAGLLANGSSCTATVVFKPTGTGTSNGTLRMTSNSNDGSTKDFALAGFGTLGSNLNKLTLLDIAQSGRARKQKKKVLVKIKAWYPIPPGVPTTVACNGSIQVTGDIPRVRKSAKASGVLLWVNSRCMATLVLRMDKRAHHKKVGFNVRFAGNAGMAAAEKNFKLRVK